MIMVDVSPTLKNPQFLTMKSFFSILRRPPVGSRVDFCINKICIWASRNLKKCGKLKIMLESCQVTSKLSADSFMSRWDRMVLQRVDFKKKMFEKVENPCSPSPTLWGNSAQIWRSIFKSGVKKCQEMMKITWKFFSELKIF